VVLVDDEPGEADPVTLIGQLVGRLPRAAILAMVDGSNVEMARQAMLAGARAFITKPLDAEELLGALQQVLAQKGAGASAEREAPSAGGRIIAYCAPKGGTGRTMLAINTAIALRQALQRWTWR
jgi:pilus assembly protein CpaE